jgi:hypothetical protein
MPAPMRGYHPKIIWDTYDFFGFRPLGEIDREIRGLKRHRQWHKEGMSWVRMLFSDHFPFLWSMYFLCVCLKWSYQRTRYTACFKEAAEKIGCAVEVVKMVNIWVWLASIYTLKGDNGSTCQSWMAPASGLCSRLVKFPIFKARKGK